MGGFEGRVVVGAKNLDRFKALTEPHVFRVLKEDCLDLPPKQYYQMEFELSPEQKKAIAMLKQTSIFYRQDGEPVVFENAVSVLGKIQEISNGFFHDAKTDPDRPYVEYFPNPRLGALLDFLNPF